MRLRRHSSANCDCTFSGGRGFVSLLLIFRGHKNGIIKAVTAATTPCSDEVSMLVYRRLKERLRGYNDFNAYLDNVTNEDLDKEQQQINKIRAWLKAAEVEPCVRSEYESWLVVYYQKGLDEARKEVATHSQRKEMEAYRREQAELFDRIRKTEAEHPIPEPPR